MANDFYESLLDSQSTALVVLDERLSISYLNAAAEALFYTGRQQLINTQLADYFSDSSKAREQLMLCLTSGHPLISREVELLYRSRQQHLVDYSVVLLEEVGTKNACIDPANVNCSKSGAPAYATTETLVVSPRHLLVELHPVDRLLRMSRKDSLQQSHQASRQLIRGVAHELKNPLVGIKGAAQLLAQALPDDAWQEYLDVIVDEVERLRELADRLLGSNQLPSKQAVNVHECLERVRRLVAMEQPELVFVRDYDPSLPQVDADQHQLVQVLLNLVRNAMQALVEHAIENATITLRTRVVRQFTVGGRRHRLGLRVDVEDNGPGVPDSLREALFFPLVSGRAQGTGLGLAIAQDIISQHQGLIECDSRPGFTRFSLLLPVTTQPDKEAEARHE